MKNKLNNAGLVIGIVLGTVLALMVTPQKGEKIRNKMLKEKKKGRFGVKVMAKSLFGYFKELGRLAFNKVSSLRKKEKNPFIINKIYRYVGKKS